MDILANTYRLDKEKVVGVVMRISLNQQNPRHQKIFKLFCEMVKIREQAHDLLCETISSCLDRAPVILQRSIICFSKEDSCVRVNASQETTADEVSSNQGKVNNKGIVHSAHAIKTTEGLIILRSFSRETDIMIIAIS